MPIRTYEITNKNVPTAKTSEKIFGPISMSGSLFHLAEIF